MINGAATNTHAPVEADRSSAPVTFVLAALIVCLGAANGGFFQPSWNWSLAVGAVLLLGASHAVDLVRLNRIEWGAICLAVAFAAWTLVASVWASDLAESRVQANRILLYVFFIVLVLLATRSVRSLVGGAVIGICAISLYALLAYLVVGNTGAPSPFEGYLLFRPVGYANALGELAALGLIAVLGLATEADRDSTASAAAAMWAPLTATLVLTQSRGAWLAFLVGVAVLVIMVGRQAMLTLFGAALVIVTIAVLSWSAHLERLDRGFNQGRARELAVAVVALSAGAYFAWPVLRSRVLGPSRRLEIAMASSFIVLSLGLAAAFVRFHALGSLGVRQAYWRVAWAEAVHHPLFGSGPGSFAVASRAQGGGATALNAHNLYLETLAETGLIGLLFLVGFLAVPLIRLRLIRKHRYVGTAAAAYTVFLTHAFVDWDWQMPVVTISGLAFGAVLLVASRDRGTPSLSTTGRHRLMFASLAVLAVAIGELVSHR